MMIKMAQEAERKAKLSKEKGPKKVAEINLSQKWLNWIIVALIAFQVYLNIAAYNAAITGLNNLSLFFTGLILIVFAGLFHVYRYALSEAKKPPPPPPVPSHEPALEKAKPAEIPSAPAKELPKEVPAQEVPKSETKSTS
jgi:ubiquinol-cytochrome c reductase cytochrome b subunit